MMSEAEREVRSAGSPQRGADDAGKSSRSDAQTFPKKALPNALQDIISQKQQLGKKPTMSPRLGTADDVEALIGQLELDRRVWSGLIEPSFL